MVLVTSAIGVFAPILMSKLPFTAISAVISIIIKQFGTGIIIATAFVHVGSTEDPQYIPSRLTVHCHSYIRMPLSCLRTTVWANSITKRRHPRW